MARKATKGEIELCEEGRGSCPLLGAEEVPSCEVKPHRIRSVQRINNGALSPKRSLVQRIRSRKNRLIQRVLVVCRLADPSKDLTFKQEQTTNNVAIEKLTAIRNNLFAHSQSIVSLSTAICCFTGNSTRPHDDSQEALVNAVAGGYRIHECSLAFSDQVENSILSKIDHQITELEHMNSLFEERAKLVLEVEYAKRTLIVEQQKGNINRIAERKQALQSAQLECERASQFIAEQLEFIRPSHDTDVFELFQEYAGLVMQFFKRGADLVGTTK